MRQYTAADFRGFYYAHRGLYDNHHGIPENSLAAFRAAAEKGYGVELDVQLSSDGQVVVFHDDTLDRVCGVHGNVADFPLADLQRMKLLDTDEAMPLFTDVLAVLRQGAGPLIVELKTGPRNTELCEKTRELLRSYPGVFCIESFDPRIVLWFRKNAPEIFRGQLSQPREDYDNSNGLPTSEANALTQTSDGFIWIGSYSGLIRYDGHTFERIDSTTGIASVVSLYADSKDRLWIGTNDSGIFLMEKDKLHICHWFTVEDLKYLKRGGRVSAATALLGTALSFWAI